MPANPVTLAMPTRGRRMRWIIIGYGLLVFLWLAPEDSAALPVVLLGAGLATLAVMLWLMGRFGGQIIPARQAILGAILSGAAVGLGASLCTVLLMFFKDARHAHVYPDFPPSLMGAIVARGPIWALAGAFAGLGFMLAYLALRDA